MVLAYKEAMTHPEKINLGGTSLEIMSDYKYTVEECKAEVLATGEDDRPIFVKNKYGEGYIYFSTVALEKYLVKHADVFIHADAPDYSLWYRALKAEIKDNRVVETDLPIVCVSEHIVNEKVRYAIVINYSRNPVSTKLHIKNGWATDEIYYGDVKDDLVALDRSDAVMFRLKKQN